MYPTVYPNEVLSVIGQRGSGKTYFTKYLISQFPKVLIIDPNHEYKGFGGVIPDIQTLLEILYYDRFQRLVFQPKHLNSEQMNYLCDRIYNYCWDCTVVIEEIRNWCNTRTIPPNMSVLVRLGRHKGIGFVGVSQRACHFHGDILSQAHHIISFRQEYVQDIEYLKQYMGDNASKIKGLNDFYYMVYSMGKNRGIFSPV